MESVIIHPQYSSDTLVNDIALLKLESNVVGGDSTAGTICIPPVSINIDDNFPVDNTAFAAGWGYVGETTQQTVIKAKEVMVPLVEDDTCKSTYTAVADGFGWLADNGEVRLSYFFPLATRLSEEMSKDFIFVVGKLDSSYSQCWY